MENFPVQLKGAIYWLPSHIPGRVQFLPDTLFRISTKFTSDFSLSYSAVVKYSSQSNLSFGNFVRLSFPFFENVNKLVEVARNSEILLLDGYKVLAICRELQPQGEDLKMGDPWY